MLELSLTEQFESANKKLYHTVIQYGTACMNGDKHGATRLLNEIKETLNTLGQLTTRIERLENLAYETQSILGVVQDDSLE
jgi:hypothetical protein